VLAHARLGPANMLLLRVTRRQARVAARGSPGRRRRWLPQGRRGHPRGQAAPGAP